MGSDLEYDDKCLFGRKEIDDFIKYFNQGLAWLDAHIIYLYLFVGASSLFFVYVLVGYLRHLARERRYMKAAKSVAYYSKEEFNTMIEDEELGTVFAYIKWPEEPCRQRRYNGQLVYYMKCLKTPWLANVPKAIAKEENDIYFNLNREHFLEPIEVPVALGNMPENLWRALHRAYDLVPVVYELPPPEWLMGMMKYAVIALCIGFLIFVVAQGKK